MEEAKWYVAHTFSGYENKVAGNIQTVVENRNLHDLIHEVAIPTETGCSCQRRDNSNQTSRGC